MTTHKNKKFDVIDPYNGHRLQGWLIYGESAYGDLQIEKINGVETNQYIKTTPKFTVMRSDHAKKVCNLRIFEKWDGMNVFKYDYEYLNKKYTSFKSRNTAVLENNDFLSAYDWVIKHAKEMKSISGNAGFELYGKDLMYFTEYSHDMKVKLLYHRMDELIPPTEGFLAEERGVLGEVVAQWKTHMEENYEPGGREGVIIYYQLDGDTYWYNCKVKPIQIRDLFRKHRAIQHSEIRTTMLNAMLGNPSDLIAETEELLEEVYSKRQILISKARIEKIEEKLMQEIVLKNKILKAFRLCKLKGKREILGWFKEHFKEFSSNDVYNVLKKETGW